MNETTEVSKQPRPLVEGERAWGNLILRRRYSTGYAARANRGSYSGTKVHRIVVEEIVEVIDEEKERAIPNPTLGKRFLIARNPVVFSAYPMCGCTQGQNAARESAGREVTCSKCGGSK
jgi:hypothetical protein